MSSSETFSLSGRRIWVTGGHGFLGRHLLAELRLRGAEVLAPTQAECDLLDPSAAARFLREHRPAGVMHLAARVGGIGANRRHPGEFFYANLAMGLHLIEACRSEGAEKLLVLGTVCAYPKLTAVPFREDDLWNGYPEETNAAYGIAKRALMVQLEAYRQEYGTRGIFLIPVNLYGPGDHLDLETNHVIPALVRKFLEARARREPAVELWGTGGVTREFLYVEDAARAICNGMARYEDPDPVNLGTGEEITIRDLAEKIRGLVGYEGEITFNPEFPDGQPRRCLDVSRARERFGWSARVTLDEGLSQTVDWARSELALHE
ncbi:MAG: GDP-L-fucose synthase [Acidobacteriota bacterium]|nr:GDP-L-fucose synthase [Acidobacteriota bacterium]